MTQYGSIVFLTDHGDGSAKLTISLDGDDHQFSVAAYDDYALVEYDESLTWRGDVKVIDVPEDIWKTIMQSDEMTEFLESEDLQSVRRKR